MHRFLFLIAFVSISLLTNLGQGGEGRPNILFITVDDLRPELGCYGAKHIHSPSIDRLAASGRLFERAYCQQAVCNPSRTSMMTGLRPDSIGVTGNHSHFRTKHPKVVTLPQHFKNHGYHAAAIGKIYHGVFPEGASSTKWDTMGDPESWSEPALRFGPRYYYTEKGVAAAKEAYRRAYKREQPEPDEWTKKLVFGPATEAPDVPASELYDGKVADAAVRKIWEFSQKDEPFFLAVGFIKPHSPYIAPKKYFDLYSAVELPELPDFPSETPSFAGHVSGELRRYTDQPKQGSIPEQNQIRVRQAYYACVSYIDAQVGKVLDALQRNELDQNTIVVLLGDHGYHLGEQGLWGKTTNFELDTRVPLVVRVPDMEAEGQRSSSLVELIDLYPTLTELAGLPKSDQFEGASFVPVLNDPARETKTKVLSQYPRGGGRMGYSMRTKEHRLTHWVDSKTGEIQETELYEYSAGLVEQQNLARMLPGVVKRLTPALISLAGLEAPMSEPKVDAAGVVGGKPSSTSFETEAAGAFETLATSIGRFVSTAGTSIIDNKHAKTGEQCLHLDGGERTSVTLHLYDEVDTSGEMTFWAERWTRREPFSFRIEKKSEGDWEEVFNGDRTVRVGRAFLSHVKVPLGDPRIKQLRLTVTSPPNTGVLLDDIRFAAAKPQRIVSVESVPTTIPALVGSDASPLFKLKIVTEGSLKPIALTSLDFKLLHEPGDVEFARVFYGGSSGRFKDAMPIGDSLLFREFPKNNKKNRPGKLSISLEQVLSEGENYVWIACRLNKNADIDNTVRASCSLVTFSDGKSCVLEASSTQRIGVALRLGGDDGVHTFRIPGLATTNKGTLIGVYDVRRRSGGDLPGDIDVGMSRSTDGGRTWEPMQVIMDMGNDPSWRYDGIGDPAVLVDRNTGTIWVAATWSHGNRSWVGSGPGLTPEETGQLMLVRSDDDGVTWSKPINITKQVKKPEWCFVLQGPGKGITMRDGTIVFAAQHQDPPNASNRRAHRLPHSTIIYSKDHGETWQVGTGAFDDTTEAQVVEVEPGVLMLNCRYNRKSARVVMTTRDMGKTWKRHSTSERSLIEPGACMASLIDVDQEVSNDMGGWLLFSNPDSLRGRNHITIKASADRGLTWPKQHRLLLDAENSAGYSCMSMIDGETVGILYEGSQAHMTFQRIPLKDVVGEKAEDKVKPVSPPRDESNTSAEAKPSSMGLKLAQVFGDHMVLQADADIPVWGQAEPGAVVTVKLGTERQSAVAKKNGEWITWFAPRVSSSTPTVMTVVSNDEQLRISDVVFGEVWLCAGQSNMEWPLVQSASGATELQRLADAEAGAGSSDQIKSLRLLHLEGGARGSSGSYSSVQLGRLTPDSYCKGKWQVADAESVREFSAVAWYFGRYLQEQLNVPVGLICPAVGGTPAEAWIPRGAIKTHPDLKGIAVGNWLDNPCLGEFCRTRGEQNLLRAMQAGDDIPGDDLGPNHSFKPGFMWEAGIKPLIPYAIRGAIWYQGESNAETSARVRQHARLFPLLIQQWRAGWKQGDFPFLFVQLPALNRTEWPFFRETQRRALEQAENLGMAITIDTGDPSNVHPQLKKPVGERLAKWALGTTYRSKKHKTYSGPLLDGVERRGASLVVQFKHVGSGLKSSDDRPLRHFEVCGTDGIFHSADAKISGADTIEVSSPTVSEPVQARYAWLPFPDPSVNLFNSEDLPASPFTTETEAELFARQFASTERDRPNVLFIVSEDNSAHLACYGEQRVHTPHLDSLARGGVRYTRAYVPYSVCSPSRAAFLTGLYTRQTGHIGLATHRFSMYRDFRTVPAYFQQAGYYTGFLGKTHVNPERLVEDFVDHRAIRNSNFGKTISIENYAEEAHAVMKEAAKQEKPFLLIINYADAHRKFVGRSKNGFPTRQVTDPIEPFPWIGSDSPRLREEIRDYFNCINRLDEGIGMVLRKLEEVGAKENTLVIYISDHGADFPRGKGSIYENGTRIPMIVNYPKQFSSGKVESGLVSTIDILPTMLRAAGLPIPPELPGMPLQDLDAGKEVPRQFVHTFTTGSSPNLLYTQFGIRDERYKLVYNPDRALNRLALSRYENSQLSPDQHVASFLHPPEYELFDLEEDPHEWNNLAESGAHRATQQRLMVAMKAFQKEINDPFIEKLNLGRFIAEQKEYQHKAYKKPGFRWPHLDMFQAAQEAGN